MMDLMGWLFALPIILCQLSLGMWLNQKFHLSLSGVSQWVLGLALLTLFNYFCLVAGCGFLIHANALALLCVCAIDFKGVWAFLRPMGPGLLVLLVLLLLSNVMNPVISGDAQSSYMAHGRHWADVGRLDFEGLYSVYASRPQGVSVIYCWGMMWGNESSCQFLGLMFFMGCVVMLAQRFQLNSVKLLLMVLMAMAVGTQTKVSLLTVAGVGGNEYVVYLLLLVLVEVLLLFRQRRSMMLSLGWAAMAMLFVNLRWNAIGLYGVLVFYGLLVQPCEKKPIFTLLLAPALGSLWYVWNWKTHGNPVYPHASEYFVNHPSNSLIQQDFSSEAMKVWGVHGVTGISDFFLYVSRLGWVMLLYPLSGLFVVKNDNKLLYALAWVAGGLAMLTTAQVKFQFFSLLVLAAFVVGARCRWSVPKELKAVVACAFVLLAWPSLCDQGMKAFALLRDARHGREYLLENRIRLYPAARWLNEQEDDKSLALFPMNPHYYCERPSLRVDSAAYQLPDDIVQDSAEVAKFLKKMKVRWVVKATAIYPSTAKAVEVMDNHVAWITQNKMLCQLVETIPASNSSPLIEIYELKRGASKE